MKEKKAVFFMGVFVGVLVTVVLGASILRWLGPAPEAVADRTDEVGPAPKSAAGVADTHQSGSLPPMSRTPAASPATETGMETESFGMDRDAGDRSDAFFVDPNELRAQFPDNAALPPVNKEEFEQKRAAREERNQLYGKITANKASAEEIKSFYDQQERLAQDSIELLEYVLQAYRGKMSERDVKKHEFLLDRFKMRLDAIPQKEFVALERLKQKNKEE